MNEATVTDDLHVIVTINGVQVDDCGPWVSREAAQEWADAIVADLNNGVDHYGNQES
jgi:hypothetical protein